MVRRAAELQMPALALTDHGAMFGAVAVLPGGAQGGREADRGHGGLRHARLAAGPHPQGHRAPPGAARARRGGLPQPDAALVARLPRGLLLQAARGPRDPVASTPRACSRCRPAPRARSPRDLLEDRDDEALEDRDDVPRHLRRGELLPRGPEPRPRHRGQDPREGARSWRSARACRIVATNDCHYLGQDHTDAQDVLICIQTGKTVDEAQRMRAVAELHFRTSEEMKQRVRRTFPTRSPTRSPSPSAATCR